MSKGRYERRRRRAETGIPIISIVGYTNAGKSTLLNALTKSETFTEDLLFATLDTASRRLRFPRERDAIITDTVGFIKNLPEDLLKAFKATLEEMEDADILIHLVDASSLNFEKRIDAVNKILKDVGLDNIPTILVFNKEDKIDPVILKNLCRRYDAISTSAIRSETLGGLLKVIEERLWNSKWNTESQNTEFIIKI